MRFNKEKRLSRVFLQLFEVGQKVCITTTKNYYFIAHLTQADLCMLSDFNELKEDLSIVNGSFVTLRDPLKILGCNVHIRDTMLLAPGSRKSLAHIGNLYPRFNKMTISKEDLEDMQGFLLRDEKKYIQYAIRDAVVSLIHAL